MITLSKIAKLAHVSVSTASKAFSMSNEVNEQTREEIALKINKAVRTVQRSIDKLKQKGKIARIGNKNYGYWEIIE